MSSVLFSGGAPLGNPIADIALGAAAISRITLIDVNGANFKSGSRLSLYGVGVA